MNYNRRRYYHRHRLNEDATQIQGLNWVIAFPWSGSSPYVNIIKNILSYYYDKHKDEFSEEQKEFFEDFQKDVDSRGDMTAIINGDKPYFDRLKCFYDALYEYTFDNDEDIPSTTLKKCQKMVDSYENNRRIKDIQKLIWPAPNYFTLKQEKEEKKEAEIKKRQEEFNIKQNVKQQIGDLFSKVIFKRPLLDNNWYYTHFTFEPTNEMIDGRLLINIKSHHVDRY